MPVRGVGGRMESGREGPKRARVPPYLPALAAATAVLAAAARAFYLWRAPTYVLTPYRYLTPLPPLYAFYAPVVSVRLLAPLAVLAAILLVARVLPAGREGWFLLFAFLAAAGLRFSVHAIRSLDPPGGEFRVHPGEEIVYDAGRIASPLDFLRDYSAIQPGLSLHGRHYPPGFALLLWALLKTCGGSPAGLGSILTCLAALVVLPGYALGRRLRDRPEDGRAAALGLATMPGLVLFGAVSLDAVYAVAAAGVAALLVAEIRSPARGSRIALGLGLAGAMLLSYSTFVLGLFALLALLLDRALAPRRALGHLAEVLAAFALPYLLLYLYPGFDAVAAFSNARRLNTEMMSGIVGKPLGSLPVWGYLSIGNLLAVLLSLGPALAASWLLLARHRFGRREAIVAGSFALTLAAACAAGLYQMETERILLYLAPLGVALAVLPEDFPPRLAAALSALQAIAAEVLLETLW
jgi:hypothetical protein